MATLESMRRRISSAEDLYSVVRVMKALAAANIRQCEKTVESIGLYNETIEHGFRVLMRQGHPIPRNERDDPPSQRTGVIICGSDQGMCGSFNEQIASFAFSELDRLGLPRNKTPLIGVGLRVVGRLQDESGTQIHSFSLPSAVAGVTRLVQELFLKIDELQRASGVERFFVVHHRLSSAASFEPCMRQVLPLDFNHLNSLASKPWESRTLPTHTMPWRDLFSALVRQHLYATLHRALAESIASENASRLASMQAAERNIEEHLTRLQFTYHQKRQQTITEELLDIVAGYEAMSPEPSLDGSDLNTPAPRLKEQKPPRI